jgi:hypothetical protein
MLIAYRKEINQAKLNLCGSYLQVNALKFMQIYLVASSQEISISSDGISRANPEID